MKAAVSGVLLVVALFGAAAAHADDWIYLQRQDGVRSYSDVKPADGKYTRFARQGRVTAGAACVGLTTAALQKRAQQYLPVIERHAAAHKLSPELVSAVMRVESCYDRKAVSRAGARGLMQLMPVTAAELGVHDSFDADQNVGGGVRYLAKMLKRFNNNLKFALAAYNAGPEAVTEYGGVPPYEETRNYVTRILKLYQPQA